MVELLKLFIEKPLNAVVTVLCVSLLSMHGVQMTTQKAVASIRSDFGHSQEDQKEVIKTVQAMVPTLARMDENLKFIKEEISKQ